MDAVTTIDIHTEYDLADKVLADKVGEILSSAYPNHLWMVTADHDAGLVYLELPYGKTRKLFPYGIGLHIRKMGGAKAMKKKIIMAGGELLERWNLARGRAVDDTLSIAAENGLDSSSAIG